MIEPDGENLEIRFSEDLTLPDPVFHDGCATAPGVSRSCSTCQFNAGSCTLACLIFRQQVPRTMARSYSTL